MAHTNGLLSPQQGGSLQALLCAELVTVIISGIKGYQLTSIQVSTLFLDIKEGFDNIVPKHIKCILKDSNLPQYLISWNLSFMTDREVSLLF